MAQTLATATRGKQDPTTNQLCYLAGVLDSDGCISISKMKAGKQRTKNPRYVLAVTVVNTSKVLMDWLVEKFGGTYKQRKRLSEKHKTTYDWLFSNSKAAGILELVEPYLVSKKGQAQVGIELIRDWVTVHGQGANTPPEEVERRENLFQEMKDLNQRGPGSRND